MIQFLGGVIPRLHCNELKISLRMVNGVERHVEINVKARISSTLHDMQSCCYDEPFTSKSAFRLSFG